jgi:hypothetical protein
VKALLLNGAVKPQDWTNSPAHPLDLRYGAGIVNVLNSWKQLTGGKQSSVEATSVAIGANHAPGSSTNNVASVGWDFSSITNLRSGPSFQDRVHHYYFTVTGKTGSRAGFTATLVWNRGAGEVTINDLNLYLYNAATGSLIAVSTSSVDNVEHIFYASLPPGRYDLQVVKSAALSLSTSETYALAYEVLAPSLSISRSGSNVTVAWPVYPDGFVLQATTNLLNPGWSAVGATPVLTNNQNAVTLPITNAHRFFRLRRP